MRSKAGNGLLAPCVSMWRTRGIQSVCSPLMRWTRISRIVHVSGPSLPRVHSSGNPLNKSRRIVGVRTRTGVAVVRSKFMMLVRGGAAMNKIHTCGDANALDSHVASLQIAYGGPAMNGPQRSDSASNPNAPGDSRLRSRRRHHGARHAHACWASTEPHAVRPQSPVG